MTDIRKNEINMLDVNEMLEKIFKYLRPIDLIIIKPINKRFYNNAVRMFNIKLDESQIFKKYFKHDFFEILDKTCVISGSSILQFLLDEEYTKYDIDIFADNTDKLNIIKSYIKYNMNGKYYGGRPMIIKNIKYLKCTTKLSVTYFTKYISDDNNKEYIQFIIDERYRYESKTALEIISEGFDFDILKNYYDGTNFHIFDKELVSKKHASNHIYTTENFDGYMDMWDFCRDSNRFRKYMKRGITFSTIDENGEVIKVKNINKIIDINTILDNYQDSRIDYS